ncbi:maleylpyruvate isomerase N-terminal domain-containing protein [Spiractinospora alimapuensis]|uniref:maleylpyruvate isomerase N-terminal domain-containing protein n=1 Tax=Spiractinospora alimapuensis TaxID=2820884 RepID=UPI001F311FD1|nr:maleylpyruvate isomerase N-terminal domain-containing protein [Spiractinospora alimapuensis]
MDEDHLPEIAAMRAEAERLTANARALPGAAWDLPSPCPPWSNRELFAHVLMTVERVPAMLRAPDPPTVADTDPTRYYLEGQALTTAASDERVQSARHRAHAFPTRAALIDHFDHTWRTVAHQCATQPPDRIVRTRHGDAMLLRDYVLTRVVELVLHGIDLAKGTATDRWSSPAGLSAVVDLLLGPTPVDAASSLGRDDAVMVAKATGRDPVTSGERRLLREHGITLFALG